HSLRFPPGHVLNIRSSIAKAGIRRLVDVCGQNFEFESGALEQIPAGRGSTCQHQAKWWHNNYFLVHRSRLDPSRQMTAPEGKNKRFSLEIRPFTPIGRIGGRGGSEARR